MTSDAGSAPATPRAGNERSSSAETSFRHLCLLVALLLVGALAAKLAAQVRPGQRPPAAAAGAVSGRWC